MKINKYGKVIISEGDILVTGFEFDGNVESNMPDSQTAALLWAITELVKALNYHLHPKS